MNVSRNSLKRGVKVVDAGRYVAHLSCRPHYSAVTVEGTKNIIKGRVVCCQTDVERFSGVNRPSLFKNANYFLIIIYCNMRSLQ